MFASGASWSLVRRLGERKQLDLGPADRLSRFRGTFGGVTASQLFLVCQRRRYCDVEKWSASGNEQTTSLVSCAGSLARVSAELRNRACPRVSRGVCMSGKEQR